jgi:hypothetical protein
VIKGIHSHIVFSFLSFFVLSTPIHTQAKIVYVLDFDGTIVDDAHIASPWKTPWVLRRIDRLNSSTQVNQNLIQSPETIEVSFAEYISLVGKWSVGNGSVGSYREARLNQDLYLNRPKTIIPGYFFVDENSTFRFYKKGPHEENFLLLNYQQAMERIKKQKLDPLSFAGSAFPMLMKAMSNPLTVGDVHIFTARNQGDEAFQMFFEQLEADGFIANAIGQNKRGLPTRPTIHQLQGIESILYGRNLVEGKKSVAESIIRQLSNSSAELTQDYSAADPTKVVQTHTVIVAEDDPNNVKALVQLLNELSHGHTTRNLKIVLMNTAPDHILQSSLFPFNMKWVVFNHGFPRPATSQEIKNYTGEKSLSQSHLDQKMILSSNSLCTGFLEGSK